MIISWQAVLASDEQLCWYGFASWVKHLRITITEISEGTPAFSTAGHPVGPTCYMGGRTPAVGSRRNVGIQRIRQRHLFLTSKLSAGSVVAYMYTNRQHAVQTCCSISDPEISHRNHTKFTKFFYLSGYELNSKSVLYIQHIKMGVWLYLLVFLSPSKVPIIITTFKLPMRRLSCLDFCPTLHMMMRSHIWDNKNQRPQMLYGYAKHWWLGKISLVVFPKFVESELVYPRFLVARDCFIRWFYPIRSHPYIYFWGASTVLHPKWSLMQRHLTNFVLEIYINLESAFELRCAGYLSRAIISLALFWSVYTRLLGVSLNPSISFYSIKILFCEK